MGSKLTSRREVCHPEGKMPCCVCADVWQDKQKAQGPAIAMREVERVAGLGLREHVGFCRAGGCPSLATAFQKDF